MIRIENKQDAMHVYVSGVMTDETCDEIKDSIKLSINACIKNIVMHINSYGGFVKGAWDIISTIKSNNLNLVASLTGCVSVLQQGLMTGNPNVELIWMNAMACGIGYLFKNFFEGKVEIKK